MTQSTIELCLGDGIVLRFVHDERGFIVMHPDPKDPSRREMDKPKPVSPADLLALSDWIHARRWHK